MPREIVRGISTAYLFENEAVDGGICQGAPSYQKFDDLQNLSRAGKVRSRRERGGALGGGGKLSVFGKRVRTQNLAKKDGEGRGCGAVFGRGGYLLRGAISLKRDIKSKITAKSKENEKFSPLFVFFSSQTIEK